MVTYIMNLRSLKRKFMASFPVVGPHADIEAELMLSGTKPITWMLVAPDETTFDDWRMQKIHEDRKRLDKAVEKGQFIAVDVEHSHPDHPEHVNVTRHYAPPENEEKLRRVVAFNKQAFNFKDLSCVDLDQDMGRYLGYRKRDILFFNNVVNCEFLPRSVTGMIVRLNAPFQQARREQLLLDAGYDLETWRKTLPSIEV